VVSCVAFGFMDDMYIDSETDFLNKGWIYLFTSNRQHSCFQVLAKQFGPL